MGQDNGLTVVVEKDNEKKEYKISMETTADLMDILMLHGIPSDNERIGLVPPRM